MEIIVVFSLSSLLHACLKCLLYTTITSVILASAEGQMLVNFDAFVENDVVMASCHGLSGDEVQWFIGDQILEQGGCDPETEAKWDVCFTVNRNHHDKVLKCSGVTEYETKMDVKYIELVFDDEVYNVHQRMTSTCVVHNARSAKVSWYLEDDFLKTNDERSMKVDKSNNKIDVGFLAILEEDDNGKTLTCEAKIEGVKSLAKGSRELAVEWENATLEGEMRLNAEAFGEGDIVQASCHSRSGERFKWFIDNEPIEGEDCYKEMDSQWDTCFEVSRNHQGSVLKCVVDSPGDNIFISRKLDVKYADLFLNAVDYMSGDTLKARCVVYNSQTAAISWYLDDVFIKEIPKKAMGYDMENNRIEVILNAMIEDDNGKELRCQAQIHALNDYLNASKILDVESATSFDKQHSTNPSKLSNSPELLLDKRSYLVGDTMKAVYRIKTGNAANVTCVLDDKLLVEETLGYTRKDSWRSVKFSHLLTETDDSKELRCVAHSGSWQTFTTEMPIFVDPFLSNRDTWFTPIVSSTLAVTAVACLCFIILLRYLFTINCFSCPKSDCKNFYSELESSSSDNSSADFQSIPSRPLPSTPRENYFNPNFHVYNECSQPLKMNKSFAPTGNTDANGYLTPKPAVPHEYMQLCL